jgi:hypothetical protein
VGRAKPAKGVDPKLQVLARLGFLARGLVYLVVGLVAARVALLERGRTTGPAGALQRIFELGHGRAALSLIGGGLLAFVAFRLVQAARVQGTAKLGYVVGAIGGLLLTLSAAGLLLGIHRARGQGPPLREMGAWLLAHPTGRVLLGLGGAIACVAGLAESIRALLGRLPRDFVVALAARQRWVSRLARLGVFAHGLVVVSVGASVVQAAMDLDEREILGTGAAIRRLRLATSPAVFAGVAVGLVAYGISLAVLSAHRRRSLR